MRTSISRANIVEAARILRTKGGTSILSSATVSKGSLLLSRADVIHAFDLVTKNRTVTNER
jgi:hypothetical protein